MNSLKNKLLVSVGLPALSLDCNAVQALFRSYVPGTVRERGMEWSHGGECWFVDAPSGAVRTFLSCWSCYQ